MKTYSTAAWARAYTTKYGLSIVPLPPRTKRPLTEDWGNKLLIGPAAEDYYQQHPNDNLGVALGPSRLCSLDVDDEPAFREILLEFGRTPAELAEFPTIQGRPPGYRVMFHVPDGIDLRYHKLTWPKQDGTTRFTVLELRASESGQSFQDVFPPSIHPDTGQPYVWLVKPNGHFPEPPAWLLTIWQQWDKFKPQMQDVCPWAPRTPPPPARPATPRQSGSPSVIDAYNAATALPDALTRYGYKQMGKRWLSPHSGTGLPGVHVFEDGRCWIHHASDPLCSDATGQPVGAFDLFAYYEHGGDVSKAVKHAAGDLGMKPEPRQRQPAPAELPTESPTAEPPPIEPESMVGTVVPPANSSEWPPSLDLEYLSEHEPEPPKFIIPDWLPAGYATLFAGHGGIGKSALALNLAVCIAAGVPYFGMEVGRRRVLYLACEDRENVLHWRLSRICAHLGVPLDSLRGWLEIIDLVGSDAILWEKDPITTNTITPSYGRLDERMKQYNTEVLMLDGVSDTFAGNENARADVKRYVNGLVALIPPDTGAVILIGHVAKPSSTAGASGDGYSGSTGWHNSVRARWYLYPETTPSEDGDRAEKSGDLILELQKSNLGRTDQEMRFAWDDEAHMFLGKDCEQSETRNNETEERNSILSALEWCINQPEPVIVPTATQGKRTTYNVLLTTKKLSNSLSGRPGMKRFWRLVESLRQYQEICEVEHTRIDRKKTAKYILTTNGEAVLERMRSMRRIHE